MTDSDNKKNHPIETGAETDVIETEIGGIETETGEAETGETKNQVMKKGIDKETGAKLIASVTASHVTVLSRKELIPERK